MITPATAPIRARRLACSPVLRDLLVAVAAFAATLAVLAGGRGASRDLDPLGVVLAAAASFPLLLHRRSPLGAFAATTAASAALSGLGYALGPPFGPTVALFFVASDERTRSRIRTAAVVVLGLFMVHIGVSAISNQAFPTAPILFGVLVWGGAFVVGDQVRQRRRRTADLLDRARRAEHELERERRLAAAEERTRIARDLHDSAAHAINVILVQAGAARLLQQRDPAAATRSLTTIEEVARETIGEIDQLVRALREDGEPDAVEPPNGLAALGTLVERHRGAGLAVDVRVSGPRRQLAPGVDQASYRILQEALTNAGRHGSGRADVEIEYGEEQVTLAVSNPVGPDQPAGVAIGGHGILGMRERAALLGGSLEVDRRNGRFHVRAQLPYATAESG